MTPNQGVLNCISTLTSKDDLRVRHKGKGMTPNQGVLKCISALTSKDDLRVRHKGKAIVI